MKTLLRGGTVVSGSELRRADVLIENEKIVRVGQAIPAEDAAVVDVSGRLLFPGFIDAHTHFDLDVCNTTTADDFASGTLSAVCGGTTTVVMPDIGPGKARALMRRVTATGDTESAFAGAEAFEGDEGALEPPADGETVVYFFTETAGDVMLVARKTAERLET